MYKRQVVYTTNGSCPNTVNNTITVNALDGATFAYSSSSLAQTGTASLTTTPTTSGGVFSAYPSGLSINSSTGEIDLASSTIQSYKIFYETSGAGCPNSSTFDLAVTASSISNVYSMSFDGSNDYIDFGDNINISGDATFSFWLYRESTSPSNEGGIITIAPSGATSDYISISLWSDKIQAVVSNGSTTNRTSTQTISKSSWHHIVVIKSSTAITSMYINGSSETLATGGGFHGTLTNLPQATLMKAEFNGTNYYSSGKLDEVAIWNTALTASQIQSIYDATSTNLTKDLSTIEPSNLKYFNRMGD